jgi:hypothetical protein
LSAGASGKFQAQGVNGFGYGTAATSINSATMFCPSAIPATVDTTTNQTWDLRLTLGGSFTGASVVCNFFTIEML